MAVRARATAAAIQKAAGDCRG
ncbi:MAG: hypothetical protein RL513_586, partial [Pseudomonadota bacterium]